MNKCFIEYPNRKLYICYDGVFCYINLVLDKQNSLTITLYSLFIIQSICYMVLNK